MILLKSILVTVAVALGFGLGDGLGLPVWLQGFFLIPAMLLFYRLSGDERPTLWKMLGFTALLSVYVLMISIGFKFVPERYMLLYFVVASVFVPFVPIVNWFERRFSPNKDKANKPALDNP